jgi:histidinol-phosphate phosphatase family protein
MTVGDLAAVHARLDSLLASYGARIDRYECCPHDRDACSCRKPSPEMLQRAAAALGQDPAQGVMIGDAESDVSAGRAAGASTYWIGRDVATPAEAVEIALAARSR